MAGKAFTKPKPTPGKVLESFGDSTSAHGVPKIISATSYLSSFLWSAVTIIAFALFCYQGGRLVVTYFQWPYTTKLDIVTRSSLQFPAVTVCNMNKLRRSQIIGTEYEGLIDLDGGPDDSVYDWWFDWLDSDYSPVDLLPGSDQRVPFREEIQESDHESVVPSVTDSPTGMNSPDDTAHDDSTNVNNSTNEDNSTDVNYPTDAVTSGDVNVTSIPPSPSQSPASQPEIPSYDPPSYSPNPLFRRKRSVSAGGMRGKKRAPRQARPLSSEDLYGRFGELTELEERPEFQFYDFYGFDTVNGAHDWAGFLEELLDSGDFSKWSEIITPPRSEIERMGHQETEFIAQCSFDKKNCSAADFYKFQNNLYGNCYVFNHAVNMTTPRDTGKTGAQNGLHLTLFVEQPEYIGLMTQETGVRVAIHDPYSIPYPEDDGFTVPTGVSSSIGIRQTFIQRLGEPHGNCTSGANSNFSSTEFQYSRRACLKHCFQNHLESKCGCVTDVGMDELLCSVVNSTQQLCRQLAENLFQDDLLDCVCPTPCSEFGYRKTVSSSTWPSERFEPHLVNVLSDNNGNIEKILQNVSLTRKNLVQLKIYFEELNFEFIEQTPLYTIDGLLGGVGGLMGLYVGFSVITLFEMVVFLYRFLRATWHKVMDRDKVMHFSAENDPQAVPDYNYGYKGTGLL